ncbi:MAG: hypothetical protein XE08_0577 [Parcubacteria bacterium 32_520]|nr:MAG: hypothetical protein XE08_0577 [Parcubacteria bacterium 32_520]
MCEKRQPEKIRKVEERHPLKQGLKQPVPISLSDICQVEERHPLKQGLKHSLGLGFRN